MWFLSGRGSAESVATDGIDAVGGLSSDRGKWFGVNMLEALLPKGYVLFIVCIAVFIFIADTLL